MKVNINWPCRVVLLARGVAAIKAHYDDLGVAPTNPPLKVGDVWRGALWEAMQIFGPSLFMGPISPFEAEIEIEEPVMEARV